MPEEDPTSAALWFALASRLHRNGQWEDARTAYLHVLDCDPSHRDALTELGLLLQAKGYRSAARTLFSQAVGLYPSDPGAHIHLANLLRENGEWLAAKEHYGQALAADPTLWQAHQGLSYVLAEIGDDEAAYRHREAGFRNHAVNPLPLRSDTSAGTVLLLNSALGGNTPTASLLDDQTFQIIVLIVDYFTPGDPLPAHDLIVNAISDADLCMDALRSAQALTQRSSRPVINDPNRVCATGRVPTSQRFAAIPGVVTARTTLLSRADLTAPGSGGALNRDGWTFPLLLRSLGHHTGRHFARVDDESSLRERVAELPGDPLMLIESLPTASRDGFYRKYRVMFVGDEMYPLHLAISREWKVHYFSSEMGHVEAFRREEARFLDDMAQVLGTRALAALACIQQTLGLDYAGVDFGLTDSGDLLLFEANATMIVPPVGTDPRFAYRQRAVDAIISAYTAMLCAALAET